MVLLGGRGDFQSWYSDVADQKQLLPLSELFVSIKT